MKRFSTFRLNYLIPVTILLAGILFSCVNDIDTIQKVSHDPSAPDEVIKNLKVFRTDAGNASVQIVAALAESYNEPKKIIKLKDGLKVDFFSETGEIISSLTALYGEIDKDTGIMMVRDSVVLRNLEKKQNLETEELYYNEGDSTIFTDKNVIIKKDGKGVIGRGRGIKTTQFFYKGVVTHPEGKIDFSDE